MLETVCRDCAERRTMGSVEGGGASTAAPAPAGRLGPRARLAIGVAAAAAVAVLRLYE
jgi:hypothetical protein